MIPEPARKSEHPTGAKATGRSSAKATGRSGAKATADAGTTIDDELWSAIGDPTRRRLLDLLAAGGPNTATALGDQLPVSRQAVAKHLGVLDRAGLVHGSTAGRERRYRIDEAQFERAVAQLHAVSDSWDSRLRRIKRLAETLQRAAGKTARPGAGRTAHEARGRTRKKGV